MKKAPVANHKQGAASRGLQLVALIQGVPTQDEVQAFADALCAAHEDWKLSQPPRRAAKKTVPRRTTRKKSMASKDSA